MRFIVSLLFLCASCVDFGANLPPGAAGGSFLDEPKGAVPLSAHSAERQRELDAAMRAHVNAQIDVVLGLRIESDALRTSLLVASREIGERVAKEEKISAADLKHIRALARRYLELDALLYAIWTSYRDHLPYGSEPDPYAPMRAATLLSTTTREAGGLCALTAELMRLDNAKTVIDVLGPHHALTRFLNRGDDALSLPAESFDRTVGALYDPDHRSLIERQLDAMSEARERLQMRRNDDPRISALLEIVAASPTAEDIAEEGDGRRRVAFLWNVSARSWLNLFGPFVDLFIDNGYVEDDGAGQAAAP